LSIFLHFLFVFSLSVLSKIIILLKVCNAFGERKNLHTVLWLDALNHAEQNKDSTGELIRKIEEAVSGTLNKFEIVKNCITVSDCLKYAQ